LTNRDLPPDLRAELDQLIARSTERGIDRATLIQALKRPAAPAPRLGRGRGRPCKDKNIRDVCHRVLKRMVNGESLFAATEAIASEESEPGVLSASRARRIRAAVKRRGETRSNFDLAADNLVRVMMIWGVISRSLGADSDPARAIFTKIGDAFEILYSQDNARGKQIQRGEDFRRRAEASSRWIGFLLSGGKGRAGVDNVLYWHDVQSGKWMKIAEIFVDFHT
jgi:hypothetical protein